MPNIYLEYLKEKLKVRVNWQVYCGYVRPTKWWPAFKALLQHIHSVIRYSQRLSWVLQSDIWDDPDILVFLLILDMPLTFHYFCHFLSKQKPQQSRVMLCIHLNITTSQVASLHISWHELMVKINCGPNKNSQLDNWCKTLASSFCEFVRKEFTI